MKEEEEEKGRRIRVRSRKIIRRKKKSRKNEYMRMVTMMSGLKENQIKKRKGDDHDGGLTHYSGRVTQICVFNTVNLGTSASSP